MNYRQLGNTGLEVSEIGFGAWGIGSDKGAPAYGATDDQESKAALRKAYDLGVNFYDTSDFYGSGHSERLIGESLNDVRSSIVIATKVGLLNSDWHQNFSPQYIRQALEASLARLQTDYIDLYQLHGPTIKTLEEDDSIQVVFQALQREGKIRAFGISVASPDDGLDAISRLGFNSIQVNLNLADQRAVENGLLDLAQRQGAGIIVRTPLCFGFLTGAYSTETEFDATDSRRRWQSEQIQRWSDAGRLFASSLKTSRVQTNAQLALRYCLSYDSVAAVIPGMLTTEHVEENVQASQMGPLSKEDRLMAEKTYRENMFFVGS
jgi:aryl-alcohol dehydrogenase-like predicted oxidoreductase